MGRPANPSRDIAVRFASGIAAGAAIGVGGWIYATLRPIAPYGPFLGSLAFSLGIVLVCVCGLMLYTGKIGYMFRESLFAKDGKAAPLPHRALSLAAILAGNAVGAFALGLAARWLSPAQTAESLAAIVASRNAAGTWETLLRSVLCGVLVYAGVDLYARFKGGLGVALVAACIAAFVLLGFDHCVANAFYWGGGVDAAGWEFPIRNVLMCAFGNSVGALAVDSAKRAMAR